MTDNNTLVLLGATGFVGNELGQALSAQGYHIRTLVRGDPKRRQLAYPAERLALGPEGEIPIKALEGARAVINLAGEPIADGRWSSAKKRRIRDSRVHAVQALGDALKRCQNPPSVVVQASAVGYYGADPADPVDEQSPSGKDFLATTCIAWEDEAQKAFAQQRLVLMRLGVVFGTTGGALPEILQPYAMGIGASLGKQMLCWVHIADVCRFVSLALQDENFRGVYNLSAPQACSYDQLHTQLRKMFSAPNLTVPSTALKIGLGEKANLLLGSQHVLPKRLIDQGFVFQHQDIEHALHDLLGSAPHNSDVFHSKQWLPCSLDEAWNFFSHEKNLERITPPWLEFHVQNKSTDTIHEGTRIEYKLKIRRLPVRWISEIRSLKPKQEFQDYQIRGPYALWQHTHRFTPLDKGCVVEDWVRFRLPGGLLGRLFGQIPVRSDINKIFAYRRQQLGELFGSSAPKM